MTVGALPLGELDNLGGKIRGGTVIPKCKGESSLWTYILCDLACQMRHIPPSLYDPAAVPKEVAMGEDIQAGVDRRKTAWMLQRQLGDQTHKTVQYAAVNDQ